MLSLHLAEIIHKERQAEIERTLTARRLLERVPGLRQTSSRSATVRAARQTSAGAAS